MHALHQHWALTRQPCASPPPAQKPHAERVTKGRVQGKRSPYEFERSHPHPWPPCGRGWKAISEMYENQL
eukprot:3840818-Amphidinium_carterae.1